MLRSRRFMRSDHPAFSECECHSRTISRCWLASSDRSCSQSGFAVPKAAAKSSSVGTLDFPRKAFGRMADDLSATTFAMFAVYCLKGKGVRPQITHQRDVVDNVTS